MIEKLADSPNGEALNWMFEMEMVGNPVVLNSLILNIMAGIKGVKDVEFVIDERQKKLLVFIELSWWQAKFHRLATEGAALEKLDQVLPSFKKRIIFDRVLLAKALKIAHARKA